MSYKIIDLQGDNGFLLTKQIFKTKKDIIKALADFHNHDYDGVKEDEKSYKDIFEFLNTLKNDTEKLNWLLDYGQWEIKTVKKGRSNE